MGFPSQDYWGGLPFPAAGVDVWWLVNHIAKTARGSTLAGSVPKIAACSLSSTLPTPPPRSPMPPGSADGFGFAPTARLSAGCPLASLSPEFCPWQLPLSLQSQPPSSPVSTRTAPPHPATPGGTRSEKVAPATPHLALSPQPELLLNLLTDISH